MPDDEYARELDDADARLGRSLRALMIFTTFAIRMTRQHDTLLADCASAT